MILTGIDLSATEGPPECDLADQHAGINADGMHGMELKCPLIDGSQVDQIGRDVDENAQPPDRRTAPNNWHITAAAHRLLSVDEINAIRFEHHASLGDGESLRLVFFRCVQRFGRVNTTPIAKPEIIGVRGKLTFSKWPNNNVPLRDR